jgi:hypothetical protein
MFLSKVSSVTNHSKRNEVAFKSRLVIEGGGSNKKLGSLKELVQTNSGQDLFTITGTINDDPKGFHGNDHFNKLIADAADVQKHLERDIKNYKKQIQEDHMLPEEEKKVKSKLAETEKNLKTWNELPSKEKPITKLALLLPGTIRGKVASFLPNLLKTDGNRLEGVKLCGSIREMRKRNLLAKTFDTQKDFVPLKDLGATGVEIASLIVNNPIYSKKATKGFFAVAVHPGGGFGSVDIRFREGGKRITMETNESGHDRYFDPRTGKESRLGEMGASVGSVIENFATKFGIKNNDDIQALRATGNAMMVTQSKISLKTANDAKAIEALLNTGAYKVINRNTMKTVLKLKDTETERFNQATKSAIDSYAYAISVHANQKIDMGANLLVVSSPLTMGLNDQIKKNPSMFDGVKDMRELILKKIDEKIGADQSCSRLIKDNNFDVICDAQMSIKDNTKGGALILAGKTSFERRGEWIEVSRKVLRNALKK